MARRPSDDASICLAIRMFCQFTSSDVKAIPAAFIETTYSIIVTAKRIKQKMPALPCHLRCRKALTLRELHHRDTEELTYKSRVPLLKEHPGSLRRLNNIYCHYLRWSGGESRHFLCKLS